MSNNKVVVEYVVDIAGGGLSGANVTLVVPGLDGFHKAQRLFEAVTSARRPAGGYVNLIAYPNAAHTDGLILAQRSWEED
jgi:hypothetical protein